MTVHIHGQCYHQCQCNFPTRNGCVADIMLWLSQQQGTATTQDLQNFVDISYGLSDPTLPIGSSDIP